MDDGEEEASEEAEQDEVEGADVDNKLLTLLLFGLETLALEVWLLLLPPLH